MSWFEGFWRRSKPPNDLRQKPPRLSHVSPAVGLALEFVRESSDAFPPLKSAVGALLAIYNICDNAKGNKERAHELRGEAQSTIIFLAGLFRMFKDNELPKELPTEFEGFLATLQNIVSELAQIQRRKNIFSSILHSREDATVLISAEKRLACANIHIQLTFHKQHTKDLTEVKRLTQNTDSKVDIIQTKQDFMIVILLF
ncbi:hypothetical protein BD410DRAFT_792481 [Rickenella mellea]|uniref:Fungal STAND N-terminal Goodbye domain-containing protein n=1 Tax=Rickenella mellea TaxID=50990 RepID=A0A4Y7PVJ1_9AGAM|nr:hypothetical protein BD410DRAFT_792481 [Rickenella mellea]